MACTQQSAVKFIKNNWETLVNNLKNVNPILDSLHSEIVFSEEELCKINTGDRFDKNRTLLRRIINQGEKVSQLFLQKLYNARKRTLPEDLHSRINILNFIKDDEPDIGACQVYQNKLRSEAKRIIKEEREKITSFLQKEEKPSDFKYIPVVLDTDESEFYKSTKYKKARHKKIKAYIPCAERKLVIEDLLQSQEKNILLVGKPGIGKTTAAHQLMNLWIDRTYQGPKYMFYFNEETLDCISTPLSLKSLLFDFYCDPENPTDKDEVFHDIVQNSKDVFIILDGFSKPKFKSHINPSCTADLNISLLIYSIVEKKLLPDAKILIACRPDTEHCVQAEWINNRVEVLGFSKESIVDYFKTMLAGKENAISADLFSLCHVPMYASIVARCILAGYSKSDSQSKTVTEIYLHIFRYSIDKHKEKDKTHHSEELDKYIKDNRRELMSLAKIAFDGMLKKEENFADLSLDDSVQHCFLRSTSLPGTETTKKKYSAFLHNTMQEFFAALWLLENPSEISDIIQRGSTPEERHLRCMLSFFCGFLAKNNSNFLKDLFPESHINSISILPELIKTFVKDREEADILFACQCLYEAQSPDACLQFLKESDFNLYLNSQLDPYQCCAVAYVIKQVQGEKVHLNLQNFIASDTKCKLLLGCMENIDSSRLDEEDRVKFIRSMYSIQSCENFKENIVSFQNLIGRELKYGECSSLLDQDVESLKWFLQISSENIQLILNGDIAACVSLVDRLSALSNWRLTDETLLYICNEIPVDTSGQFLKGLNHKIHFSKTQLEEHHCRALALVISNSAMPVKLDISECDVTSNGVCILYTCASKMSKFRIKQEMYPVLWRGVLWGGQKNDVSHLLRLCKNTIHLTGEKTVLSRAAEVIKTSTQKITVYIHWIPLYDQLHYKLIDTLFTCLPNIAYIKFCELSSWKEQSAQWKQKATSFLLGMVLRAAEYEEQTGHAVMTPLLSAFNTESDAIYTYSENEALNEFLLDLYSCAKEYETQTGKKVLQILLPVYKSSPKTWVMDLSKRKPSLLHEILITMKNSQVQSVKRVKREMFAFFNKENRPLEVRHWTTEESELRSLLECLQHVSELRFYELYRWNEQSAEWKQKTTSFLLNIVLRAAEYEEQTGHRVLQMLLSTFSNTSDMWNEAHTEFLLNLYSYGKEYETEPGKKVLETLLPVYQSIPKTWILDLDERKASLFIEIVTFCKVKRPVEVRHWTTEESELRSLLECLQYITELRFHELSSWTEQSAEWKQQATTFLLDMVLRAAEYEEQTGHRALKPLLSAFIFNLDIVKWEFFDDEIDLNVVQTEFLLDLYSHGKKYETQTGKKVLQTLLPVYQSSPKTWVMDFSKRKTSLLLEIVTFYQVKKPAEVTNWKIEESELRSLLECLQYVSELNCGVRVFLDICETLSTYDTDEAKKQSSLFMQKLNPALTLPSLLTSNTCRSVGEILQFAGPNLKLSLTPSNICLEGIRLLTESWTRLEQLRINEMLTKKVARLLMSRRQKMPVTVEEITLDLSSTLRKPRRASVLMSNLAFILRHWTVSCLDLSACTIKGHSLLVLLCQQKHVNIKLSKESLQHLALAVYEAQEDMLAASFLEKVDHDLTSCNLTWEVLHFLLQQARQRVKVDWRKSKLQENNMKELIPLLHRIHTLRLSAAFCKRIVQEIVQRGDHELIFSFLEATDNCLNLNSSVLSFTDCEALRHFIAHSNNVRLDIHWTSISEDDIEKLLPVVGKLAQICLDRHMLLRFLHAITRSGDPWAARSFLKALQCKLNLSSSDAIDITEEESSFCLTLEDCKAISTTLLLSDCESELILDDCEIQDDGLEWLFNVFQNVKLRTNKMILQRLLILTYGNDRSRGLSLSAATRNEIDLSDTPLNEDTCRALAHVVHSSEGGWELDLSNCGLSDQSINQLQICLHRIQMLDLSKNDITDSGAMMIHEVVCRNPFMKTVRLFNNEIKNMQIFQTDSRYEI